MTFKGSCCFVTQKTLLFKYYNVYQQKCGKTKPRHRWVDNIRMDLGEVGWGNVNWIGLAKDKNRWRVLVNSVLNLRVP
jgi:hypothetical protein